MNVTWVKSHTADVARLADLLIRAKGGRSMRAFAKECGFNPATFSRIVNGINMGSSSPKLIEAVAKCAAHDSGVTLEMLADANGYTLKANEVVAEKLQTNPVSQPAYELVAQSIVIRDMLESYKSVRIRKNVKVSDYTHIQPALLMETESMDGSQELFFVEIFGQTGHDGERVFEHLSHYVWFETFRIDGTLPLRFLMVIVDLDVYRTMKERLGSRKLPINLDAVYVDVQSGTLVERHRFYHILRYQDFMHKPIKTKTYLLINNLEISQAGSTLTPEESVE